MPKNTPTPSVPSRPSVIEKGGKSVPPAQYKPPSPPPKQSSTNK